MDSLRDALTKGAADSAEHRALRRAVKKAHGDRDLALRNVARLLGTKVEALSPHILAVVDGELKRGCNPRFPRARA